MLNQWSSPSLSLQNELISLWSWNSCTRQQQIWDSHFWHSSLEQQNLKREAVRLQSAADAFTLGKTFHLTTSGRPLKWHKQLDSNDFSFQHLTLCFHLNTPILRPCGWHPQLSLFSFSSSIPQQVQTQRQWQTCSVLTYKPHIWMNL